MNWFKRLFKRKEKRKTYMYLIAYYDFMRGTTHLVKQTSEHKLEQQYPSLYTSSISNIKMLLIYEEDYYSEDEV